MSRKWGEFTAERRIPFAGFNTGHWERNMIDAKRFPSGYRNPVSSVARQSCGEIDDYWPRPGSHQPRKRVSKGFASGNANPIIFYKLSWCDSLRIKDDKEDSWVITTDVRLSGKKRKFVDYSYREMVVNLISR